MHSSQTTAASSALPSPPTTMDNQCSSGLCYSWHISWNVLHIILSGEIHIVLLRLKWVILPFGATPSPLSRQNLKQGLNTRRLLYLALNSITASVTFSHLLSVVLSSSTWLLDTYGQIPSQIHSQSLNCGWNSTNCHHGLNIKGGKKKRQIKANVVIHNDTCLFTQRKNNSG